jgi:hypothetical protein
MRIVESSFNPEASRDVDDSKPEREMLLNPVNVEFLVENVNTDPATLHKWREVIDKEINDIDDKKVWKVINKEEISGNK